MKLPPDSAVAALRKFGKTPDGLPLWRVIWSPDKIGIADGELQQEYAEPYRWVLEKCCLNSYGPDEWERTKDPETGEYILGPYTKWTYEHSYSFPDGCELGSSIVELIPRLITAGIERFTFSQRMNAAKELMEKRKRDWEARFSDIWDDSKAAFHGAAFSGPDGHRVRGPEDIPIRISADAVAPEFRKGFRQV